MPQVPYAPYGDITAQDQPIPGVEGRAPPAAFGSVFGDAFKSLGQVSEKAGDELYTRAMAMQQLNNEASARQQAVQFSMKATDLYAQFKEKYGANAGPEALTAYKESLAKLREDTRAGLGNPMAQKMYDGETFNFLDRLYFSGAVHSADQLKQLSIASHKMAGEEAANQAGLLTDPQSYGIALTKSEESARKYAAEQGWDEAQTKQYVAEERSKVTAVRIGALAREDIEGAKKLFDEALKKGELRGESIAKLTDLIHRQENQIGSRNITHGIIDGSTHRLGKGMVNIEDAGYAIGMRESGGNYGTIGKEVTDSKGNTGKALGKYGVMSYNLASWLEKSGLPKMSQEEFLKDTKAQDKVFQTIFGGYLKKYGNGNDAAVAWFAGEGSVGKTGVGGDGTTTVPQYLTDFNKYLRTRTSPEAQAKAARDHAAEIDPNNPTMQDFAEQRVTQQTRAEQTAAKETETFTRNTVFEAIEEHRGKVPLTPEDLSAASPKFKQIWDGANAENHAKIMSILEKATKWDNENSPERERRYNMYLGAAHLGVESFRNEDLSHADLTYEQRKELVKIQRSLLGREYVGDPWVKFATSDKEVRRIAATVGATPTGGGADEWSEFAGALTARIQVARAMGKPLSQEDIRGYATELAETKAGSGWGPWGIGDKPAYKVEVERIPEVNRNKIIADLKLEKPGIEPSTADIEHRYARWLYTETMKKAGKDGK